MILFHVLSNPFKLRPSKDKALGLNMANKRPYTTLSWQYVLFQATLRFNDIEKKRDASDEHAAALVTEITYAMWIGRPIHCNLAMMRSIAKQHAHLRTVTTL